MIWGLIWGLIVIALIVVVTPATGNPPVAQRLLQRWGFAPYEAWVLQVMLLIVALIVTVAIMLL